MTQDEKVIVISLGGRWTFRATRSPISLKDDPDAPPAPVSKTPHGSGRMRRSKGHPMRPNLSQGGTHGPG